MIFGVVFIGLRSIMTPWLQINEDFTMSTIIGTPFNIFIISEIIISFNGNIRAIGNLLGIASQFFFQLPFTIKK